MGYRFVWISKRIFPGIKRFYTIPLLFPPPKAGAGDLAL
jgi:hypothetical protein